MKKNNNFQQLNIICSFTGSDQNVQLIEEISCVCYNVQVCHALRSVVTSFP